jgi:hypothetical protein
MHDTQIAFIFKTITTSEVSMERWSSKVKNSSANRMGPILIDFKPQSTPVTIAAALCVQAYKTQLLHALSGHPPQVTIFLQLYQPHHLIQPSQTHHALSPQQVKGIGLESGAGKKVGGG